jgi:hypothetical protein
MATEARDEKNAQAINDDTKQETPACSRERACSTCHDDPLRDRGILPVITTVNRTQVPGLTRGVPLSSVAYHAEELDPVAAYALGSAMDGLLQQSGPLLCVLRPQYASSLGGGLFEFRFQDLTEDLLRQLGKKARRGLLEAQQKVLFRVFFHPHGDKVLLPRRLRQRPSIRARPTRTPRSRLRGSIWRTGRLGTANAGSSRLDLAMHKAHIKHMAKTWNHFMKGLEARAKAGGPEHVWTLRALRSHYWRMGQELAEERRSWV